jgi:flagellar protein FlaG
MTITTFGNTGAQNAVPLPAAPQGAHATAAKTAVVVADPAPQQQQPKPEQLLKAIESMKRMIETKAPNSLAFSVDASSGKTIVKITDRQTGEMIRQIPSEEMLEIARSLDKMQGMLLQQKA